MKCSLCGKEIEGYPNEGYPLTEGKVCDKCNWKVIRARMDLANKKDKSADEEETDTMAVLGTGAPGIESPEEFMNDFEKYAKAFKKEFGRK